jgi:Cu(I)/Ag(I) efflux system periplasmic protein CusF
MKFLSTAILLAALAAGPVAAQNGHDHSHGASTAQTEAMSDGEVRRIDKATRKITLRHGPLTNLDMPSMTMVFEVRDPLLLDKVKAGDKVKFTADKVNGTFVITAIEPAK